MAQRQRQGQAAHRRTGTRPMRARDRDRREGGPGGESRRSERQGRRSGTRGAPHDAADAHAAPRRGPGEGGRTPFDGFAEHVTRVVSSAYFFAFCVAGVVAWALFGPGLGYSQTWQLIINTATTILTFLMVAVLQNSSRRGERALQAKLDAIADALADFMDKADIELDDDVKELQEAVGLEERVGSR